MKILQVKYHRNGVAGDSYTSVLFKEGKGTFLAIDFKHDAPDEEANGKLAIIEISQLSNNNVISWRYEDFEAEIRAVISKDEDERHEKMMNQLDK
jgi:hypothetical protein